MADLVAVMREGELQQLAPPDEIYDRPANRFVADLRRQSADERARRAGSTTSGQTSSIGDAAARAGRAELGLRAGRRSTALGVRPEDLEILAQGTPGTLAGEIYVVEPMGNETLVDVRSATSA